MSETKVEGLKRLAEGRWDMEEGIVQGRRLVLYGSMAMQIKSHGWLLQGRGDGIQKP